MTWLWEFSFWQNEVSWCIILQSHQAKHEKATQNTTPIVNYQIEHFCNHKFYFDIFDTFSSHMATTTDIVQLDMPDPVNRRSS